MVRGKHAPAVTRRAQARLGIILTLPVAVLVVVFFVFPMASALYYSVVDFDEDSADAVSVALER